MEQVTFSAIQLFYSYAHEDASLCKQLDKHLILMKREGLIATWHDHDISAGAEWASEIDQHLANAQIILLLISPDFLASDYCYSVEMKRALEKHEAKKATVIPIILRPVDWKTAPFGKLLALPSEGKAVTTWDNRDLAFAHIAKGIRKVIEQFHNLLPQNLVSVTSAKQFWTVLHRRNSLFTGREKLLERLHDSLSGTESASPTRALAISGLGGIGKTQIAIEYAYRYHGAYQAVLWVNAATRETLVTDFVLLAGLLNLSAKGEMDQNLVINAVRRWLTDHDQWLLILDNADRPSLLYDFLPVRYNGHIIFTTRAQAMGSLAQSIEVEKMDAEEGIKLLLHRAKILRPGETLDQVTQENRTHAQEIVTAMDGLPLALDQAGAYIEETGCSVADYLERYKQRKIALLKRRGEASVDHPDSVVTTWSLSFEEIEQNDPAAADLLRFCAFLAPDAIPLELITANAAELGTHLQPLATDLSLLDEAIVSLYRFSLVRRNREDKTLSVHRLLQTILKANMDRALQYLWAERAVQSIIKIFPLMQEAAWSQCQRYLPHVYACMALIDDYTLTQIEVAELFYRAGYWLHEHAQYREAEMFYQRASSMKEQKDGRDHPDLAKILDSLAWLYLDQGVYQKAAALYQRALTIKQQTFGPEHSEVAKTLHALGRLHQAQRDFAQAETLYQQALTIKEQAIGSDASETATTIHALAWLYHDQNMYDRAEPLYQRALSIRKRVLGLSHSSTAITFHQLARLYHEQRHYSKAETLYRHSLEIKEQVLGPNHPFTAVTLHYFARLYHDQRLYTRAEALYQRALTIREQVLGPDHPFTATTLHHLAQLYHDQRLYTRAEALYQRALTIREQVLGPDHLITAITLHQLARLYESQSQNAQADHFYRRTLSVREQLLGHKHISTIAVAKEYAHLLHTMQQEIEAAALEARYSIK